MCSGQAAGTRPVMAPQPLHLYDNFSTINVTLGSFRQPNNSEEAMNFLHLYNSK